MHLELYKALEKAKSRARNNILGFWVLRGKKMESEDWRLQ